MSLLTELNSFGIFFLQICRAYGAQSFTPILQRRPIKLFPCVRLDGAARCPCLPEGKSHFNLNFPTCAGRGCAENGLTSR